MSKALLIISLPWKLTIAVCIIVNLGHITRGLVFYTLKIKGLSCNLFLENMQIEL